MRAYEIVSEGGIDALALNERPTPRPGPGQVRVEVRASSINYRDLATVENPAARGIVYPLVPNSDAAGVVTEIGEHVDSLAPGDRVASCFFQRWVDGDISPAAMASALGGARDGVLAEQVVLEADGVVPVPANLDFAEAATLPCAALTAWNATMEAGGALKPGQTVLLLGTGGVSVFALQFARLAGARAIVVSSSDEKLERARALGAWRTLNYRDTPDWAGPVTEMSGGGVDLVVEVGGAGTLERSIASTRVAGRIALIGVLSAGAVDPVMIMRKSLRVQGIYVGSRAMFLRMNAAIEAHGLAPVVDRRFAFEDAREAYHAMRAAGHFGKLVVTR